MKNLTLNEITREHPASRMVFEDFHLDYCCGGGQELQAACAKRGVPVDQVIEAINKREQIRDEVINFNNWPLDLLADYIEKKHHRYVTESLPLLTAKFERLVERHGEGNPVLFKLRDLFAATARDLSAHMKKEELVIFPFIRNLVASAGTGMQQQLPRGRDVEMVVNLLEEEHRAEGSRFEEMARLTNNFTPPEQACATWQFTYAKLAEFEKDLHMHIYLENSVLFPAAIEAAKPAKEEPAACCVTR